MWLFQTKGNAEHQRQEGPKHSTLQGEASAVWVVAVSVCLASVSSPVISVVDHMYTICTYTHTCHLSWKKEKALGKDLCFLNFLLLFKASTDFSRSSQGQIEKSAQETWEWGGVGKEKVNRRFWSPGHSNSMGYKSEKGVISSKIRLYWFGNQSLSQGKSWLFQTRLAGSWPTNQWM